MFPLLYFYFSVLCSLPCPKYWPGPSKFLSLSISPLFLYHFCCCLGKFWLSTSLSHALATYLCIYLTLILNSQGFYSNISNSDGKYCPIFGHFFRKLNFSSISYFGLWIHVLLGCQRMSLIICASEYPKSGLVCVTPGVLRERKKRWVKDGESQAQQNHWWPDTKPLPWNLGIA